MMRAIDEEAIAWFVRMHSDQRTLADEDRFAQWMKQDASHANAYAGVEKVWRIAGPPIAPRALQDTAQGSASRERAVRRPWQLLTAIAASVVFVAIGMTAYYVLGIQRISEGTYMAGAGDQRELRLADGSTITLNTRSEVSVDIDEQHRSVRLTRGEARFSVAKDASRPFTVDAGALRVRALGTAFDVRVLPSKVAVTLVEGRVEVKPISTQARAEVPAVLTRGQQLSFDTASGEHRIAAVDLNRADAWLRRQLIFDALPLTQAVAEANRYLDVPIVIEDASLDEVRISGVVRAGNVESFIGSLESSFPIEAVERGGGQIALLRRVSSDPNTNPVDGSR